MILKQWTPGRFLLSLTHQIGLSVSGTVVASLLLAGLHAPRPSVPSRIDPMAVRTSGGKLAARADAGGANAAGLVTLTTLPLILPMFTAPSVPQIDVALSAADVPVAPAIRSWHEAPHGGAKRQSVAEVAPSVMPPRRADYLPASLSAALDRAIGPVEPTIDEGIWTASKRIYRHVALWSGAVLDQVIP